MDELDGILALGTAKVGPPYFLLPIFGGDPVRRERVYCYELYHQMRCQWPDDCRYILNGEVDRARLIGRVQQAAAVVQDVAGIEIWHHRAPGASAERIAVV